MTLESLLRRLVAIADEVGIPYMLTGSLASAYYGEPRATRDIDFVIVVSDDELDQLVRRLDEEGFYVSREAARDARQRRSHFNAVDPESGWKVDWVDWIVRKDRLFSRREFERRRMVEVLHLELPIVTAEGGVVPEGDLQGKLCSHFPDARPQQQAALYTCIGSTDSGVDRSRR